MLFGLVMAVIVVGLFTIAARRSTLKPGSKFGFAIETLVEAIINLGEENFGSREKAIRHLPLLLTLFTFILFSNLSGLIPGVGTVNITTHDGVSPLLRPFTTDLNATLALAILTIGTVQVIAIRELGIVKHLKHYFTDKPYNPMNLFIGVIEVMGEFIRIITLSMRMFGVIYAGEVLIHVVGQLAGNYGWAATLPVYLMEIFFSGIQAYLFMMLSMVYLAIATNDDHAEPHPSPDHSPSQKTLKSAESET
jgi:F-type H+-transporting ATPase subunit a